MKIYNHKKLQHSSADLFTTVHRHPANSSSMYGYKFARIAIHFVITTFFISFERHRTHPTKQMHRQLRLQTKCAVYRVL